MSRGWKVGLGLLACVVALNVLLVLLHSLSGGTPGGRPSSSYATAPDGVAAYASLLGREGHRVSRLRGDVADANLDPATTLVLLDPAGPVSAADAEAVDASGADAGEVDAGEPDSGPSDDAGSLDDAALVLDLTDL